MTVADKAGKFNDLVQASFRNAMDAVEDIHHTSAEIPIDVLTELGYPADKAQTIKDSHRRILRIVYGGICNAHEDLGKLVVQQFGELAKLAGEFTRPQAKTAPPVKKTEEKLSRRKTAAS